MSRTMQLKRLKHPEPQRQQITEGSGGRTLKVNHQMRIIVDDTWLKEVEKWSRYNRARRLADEEASIAFADTQIAR